MLFHPSDWVCFGYTKDVTKLWNIPIPSDNNYYNFFQYKEKGKNCPHPTVMGRFVPEQHVLIECIKKYIPDLRVIDAAISLLQDAKQLALPF